MRINKTPVAVFLTFSLLMVLAAFSPNAQAQAQSNWIYDQGYNFWIKKPLSWNRAKGVLSGDLVEQIIDPSRNAFVEVYASKMPQDLTLQYIADNWQAKAQEKGIAYLHKRISSEQVDIKGATAILRIYEGATDSTALKSYLLFIYENQTAYVVVGVLPQEMASTYEELVKEIVLSFSLVP